MESNSARSNASTEKAEPTCDTKRETEAVPLETLSVPSARI